MSGQGAISFENQTHILEAGDAFMVAIPESCSYYLPAYSASWQFIFITLRGSEAKRCWKKINHKHGHVFNILVESNIVQQLFSIYDDAVASNIKDGYQACAKAFEFIATCYQYFDQNNPKINVLISDDIQMAIDFI